MVQVSLFKEEQKAITRNTMKFDWLIDQINLKKIGHTEPVVSFNQTYEAENAVLLCTVSIVESF